MVTPKSLPSIVGLIALTAISLSTSLRANETRLHDAVEFSAREGLPNFFTKINAGEDTTIAYFGGSITAQKGWRVLSQKWLEEQYPKTTITGIHAAIGGVGSSVGVFRIEKDALASQPDLLFVEFAVNDASATPENITKAMEGIIRKTWKANPETDICFVYTMTFRDSQQLANGEMSQSASVMESIAEHYGIPSIHMGYQAALMEKEGTLVMKTSAPMTRVSGDELNEAASLAVDTEGRIIFSKDGVHPYPETGHVLYNEALIRSLKTIQHQTAKAPHALVEPIRDDNWENAQQLPISEQHLSGPYTDLTAAGAPLAKRFAQRIESMYLLKPGASLSFKFKGTKISIYDIKGPDTGTIEITLDGQSTQARRMDGYCTYHRISILPVGENMEDTIHEMTIRVLDEQFDKSQVLFEKNRGDIEKSPQKYANYDWHLGAIFIVGDLIN
ncbi:SGNH/GDSL hydrolase family protein [Coraliomargarita sp. W4R72]